MTPNEIVFCKQPVSPGSREQRHSFYRSDNPVRRGANSLPLGSIPRAEPSTLTPARARKERLDLNVQRSEELPSEL
jgi:hypothetical protein